MSSSHTKTIETRADSFIKVKETVDPTQNSGQKQFGILKEARIEENTEKYPSYPTDKVIIFDTEFGDETGELVIPSDSDSKQCKNLLKWAECDSISTLCEREVPVNRYSEQIFTVPPYIDSKLPTNMIKTFSKQNFEEMYDFESDTWDFSGIYRIHNSLSKVFLLSLTIVLSSMLVVFTSLNLPVVIFISAIVSMITLVFTFVTSIFDTIKSVYCDRVVLR